MAKFNKRASKLLKKHQTDVLLILVSLLVGWFVRGAMIPSPKNNLIWAIDKTVKVPLALERYLQSQDTCREYQGPGSPTGIGLWAVMQVDQNKFAKVTHGCSWSLQSYQVAVNEKSGWRLIPKEEYFKGSSGVGALPTCKLLKSYGIPKNIEPFCISESGKAVANQ